MQRSSAPPRVGDVCTALDRIAPPRLAAEWDNVGLLAGDPPRACARALLAIDLTPAVLDEAVAEQCRLIVAYHPPIFRPIRAIRPGRDSPSALAAEALARGIAVYSPHTAWDAAPGGTNDALAAACGARDTRPFRSMPAADRPECKVVVFVPEAQLERVAAAMFEAGAGRIGQYSHCSFRTPGEGTFFGSEGASPKVGRRGRLERVAEVRLEAVATRDAVGALVRAIRRSHPYEEPALDIYPLEPIPSPRYGQGRIGTLARPTSLGALARTLARRTNALNPTVVGSTRLRVRRVLVCAGAAGSLPFDLVDDACGPGDAVVTGEIRHHDALRYLALGAAAIALGHWSSERPGLAALAERLRGELPRLDVRRSRRDREPFRRA